MYQYLFQKKDRFTKHQIEKISINNHSSEHSQWHTVSFNCKQSYMAIEISKLFDLPSFVNVNFYIMKKSIINYFETLAGGITKDSIKCKCCLYYNDYFCFF